MAWPRGGTPVTHGDVQGVITMVRGTSYNVLDYGAVGDGTTDDTTAVQSAFTACPAGAVVLFPEGYTFKITSITLGAKAVTVLAHGATIQTATAGTYAFVQTNRFRTTWYGGSFTGVGSGFSFNMAPSGTQSYDIAFSGVSFVLPTAQTGMSLIGARESVIRDCYFETCIGIALSRSVNTHVQGSQFKNCAYGVNADATATGDSFDAGLMVTGVTMIGCAYGLNIICWDHFSVVNSMIDYCDRPITVVNCSVGFIGFNYLSVRDMTSTSAPVVSVTSNGALPQGGYSQHVKITSNRMVNHATFTPTIGLLLDGITSCVARDNTIDFWSTYGIKVTGSIDKMAIVGNTIAGISTPGPCILIPGSANRTYICQNFSDQATSGSGAGITIVNNFTL